MSTAKPGPVWAAERHTKAKIALLEAYLKAWFSILGATKAGQNRKILYIDGFAGPGVYSNHPEGSPVVAIRIANSILQQNASKWTAGDVYFAFIDKDPDVLRRLQTTIADIPKHQRVHCSFFQSAFEAGVASIQQEMPWAFSSACPLFAFIDPFGATGVPFKTVAGILNSPCSEVLLNFDADGINRILQAGSAAGRDTNLATIFGDESWRPLTSDVADTDVMCRRLLALYKSRLRTLPRGKYVFSFEMRGRKGSLNYYLVFASGHALGLKKMKEAMRTVDQTGDYSFSGADLGQGRLFRFDAPADFAPSMHSSFLGQLVPLAALDDYALNDTPFDDAKKMLKCLEEQDLIEPILAPSVQSRRKGTFSDKAVRAIRFKAQ